MSSQTLELFGLQRDLLCTQDLCRAAGTLPSGQATACLSWGAQGTLLSDGYSPRHCQSPGAPLAVLQTGFSLTGISE